MPLLNLVTHANSQSMYYYIHGLFMFLQFKKEAFLIVTQEVNYSLIKYIVILYHCSYYVKFSTDSFCDCAPQLYIILLIIRVENHLVCRVRHYLDYHLHLV